MFSPGLCVLIFTKFNASTTDDDFFCAQTGNPVGILFSKSVFNHLLQSNNTISQIVSNISLEKTIYSIVSYNQCKRLKKKHNLIARKMKTRAHRATIIDDVPKAQTSI